MRQGNVNEPITFFQHELMMSLAVRILGCHVVLYIACQLLLSIGWIDVHINFDETTGIILLPNR